jgi:cytochrome c oxidase subunit IV
MFFLSVFMEMVGKYLTIIQGRLLPVPLFMVILPLSVNLTHYIVTCRMVRVTKMTGSSSDDWI